MKSPTFIEKLEASEVGKTLLKQEQGEVLAKRQEIVAKIAKLDAEFEKALPPLLKAEEAAKAKAMKANDAFQEARRLWGEAQLEHAKLASPHAYRKMQLETELQRTASPAIGEMVATLRAFHDEVGNARIPAAVNARMLGSRGQAGPMPEDLEQMRVEVAAQKDHCERIRGAVLEAQALALLALPDEELGQLLAAIKEEAEKTPDATPPRALAESERMER